MNTDRKRNVVVPKRAYVSAPPSETEDSASHDMVYLVSGDTLMVHLTLLPGVMYHRTRLLASVLVSSHYTHIACLCLSIRAESASDVADLLEYEKAMLSCPSSPMYRFGVLSVTVTPAASIEASYGSRSEKDGDGRYKRFCHGENGHLSGDTYFGRASVSTLEPTLAFSQSTRQETLATTSTTTTTTETDEKTRMEAAAITRIKQAALTWVASNCRVEISFG